MQTRSTHTHTHTSEILIGYYIIYRLPSIQLLCVLPSLLNSRVLFFFSVNGKCIEWLGRRATTLFLYIRYGKISRLDPIVQYNCNQHTYTTKSTNQGQTQYTQFNFASAIRKIRCEYDGEVQ